MFKQKNVDYHLKLKEGGIVVFYSLNGDRSVLDKQKLPYGELIGSHSIPTCGGAIYRKQVIDGFDAIVCSKCNVHSTFFQSEKITYGEILCILEAFKEARFGIIGQKTGTFQRFK